MATHSNAVQGTQLPGELRGSTAKDNLEAFLRLCSPLLSFWGRAQQGPSW